MDRRIDPRALAAAVLLCVVSLPAGAGMIGTGRILDRADADGPRAGVVEVLEREAVRSELRALGVDPAAARARVERMTPGEIARLRGQVATLPAGGDLSTGELLLIIILIVLLV